MAVEESLPAGPDNRRSRPPRREESSFRVLVVDDDEIARGAIVRTLDRMGCEVTSASNAQEAVSAFLAGKFDLITLDYRMPGLDGMALHKVLSQEFGGGKRLLAQQKVDGFVPRLPPIAVVTAYADEPDVIRAQFGESVVGVVQKPFIEDGLGRIVRDLLAEGSGPLASGSVGPD